MRFRKLICLLLALVFCFSMAITAYAAPSSDSAVYIQKILNYYRYYQTGASEEVQALLAALESEDPLQGQAWRKIMATWEWVDQQMVPEYGGLSDGLPQDNALGIVVMGYALNANGSMRQELVDRLTVALACAQSYPNAYVICTGGATAKNSSATEAGVMAQWLKDRGVASSRIIVEKNSYSTTQNAQKTYNLLIREYPQIRSLAVVTSDYHVYRSVLAFQAMSDYTSTVSGTHPIDVVGSACNWTLQESREGLNIQAETLALIAGMDLQYQARPSLFQGSQSSTGTQSGSGILSGSLWENDTDSGIVQAPSNPDSSDEMLPSSGQVVVKQDGLWTYEVFIPAKAPGDIWS